MMLPNDPRWVRTMATLLTQRQLEILKIMASHPHDDAGELVYENGTGFLNLEPVAPRTVFALIRACAIETERGYGGDGKLERYRISETGRAILRAATT